MIGMASKELFRRALIKRLDILIKRQKEQIELTRMILRGNYGRKTK